MVLQPDASSAESPDSLDFIPQSFRRFIIQQPFDEKQSANTEALDRSDSVSVLAVSSSVLLSTLAPASLAYVGDAVFELYVRSRLLIPQKRLRHYHQQVVDHVRAEQQAQYIDVLTPYLSDPEKDILRRGRNATSGRHRRATAQNYQKATGFEALIGFLYLSDPVRLLELLDRLAI